MKNGKTLQQLAAEIERQAATKKDFEADTRKLSLWAGEGRATDKPELEVKGHGRFEITETAHNQIGETLGIPAKYYDKLRATAPGLLAENVNHWLQQEPKARLVRTLDGKARAFLSNRYRPLDNIDLAEVVLPEIQAAGCRVESCELTENRLYIKAVTERITFSLGTTRTRQGVQVDDTVQAGIVITNSETGFGAVKVEPLIFRLVCLNGLIAQTSLRKYHVGKAGQQEGLEEAAQLFSDQTRRADDRAFWLKVKDVVAASLDQAKFEQIVNRFRAAKGELIEADPVKVIEAAAHKLQLNDDEKGGVLRHLIEGGDLSRFGLVNAITRQAQDVESYDRATELERLGGQVLELEQDNFAELVAVR